MAAELHFLPLKFPFCLPVLITSLSMGFCSRAFRNCYRPACITFKLPSRLPWIEPAVKCTDRGFVEESTAWI